MMDRHGGVFILLIFRQRPFDGLLLKIENCSG